MIQQEFNSQLKKLEIAREDKILLAISGGVDSMVLMELFSQSKQAFAVAHMNFSLRDTESDKDEELVKISSEDFGVSFHSKKVETINYAKERGISIQMAARELRYTWFEELKRENNYCRIATAHHLEDSVETFFINLNRGTGLKGITGISSTEEIFRPLLKSSKQEIRKYASLNNVPYREDKSNEETKYERNWIRKEIMKPLIERNENFLTAMQQNFDRFIETQKIVESFLKKETKNLEAQLRDNYLEIEDVEDLSYQRSALFYLLNKYGFTESQLNDLITCIKDKQVGKRFISNKHELLLDRKKIFLKTTCESIHEIQGILILEGEAKVYTPINLQIELIERNNYSFSNSNLMEGFDSDKLTFPLKLRKWQEGDWLIPLGMKGKKKLSDIMIDQKLSLQEKDNVFVLLSRDSIIWVVGIKTDNRFKVDSETKKVISFKLQNG